MGGLPIMTEHQQAAHSADVELSIGRMVAKRVEAARTTSFSVLQAHTPFLRERRGAAVAVTKSPVVIVAKLSSNNDRIAVARAGLCLGASALHD